ncbi:MAG: hypothetical protein M3N12_01160 [Verrucomicrobiota bacterium]|nr:hypothetical protein [Verrucomicrobiota bacterium]
MKDLLDNVAAALTRLETLKAQPISPTIEEALPALNAELRKLLKQLRDEMNTLRWGKERKGLLALTRKIERALSGWEYDIEIDVSMKRIKEIDERLSAGGLNDSRRRRLERERRKIQAVRQSFEEKHAGPLTAPIVKSTAQTMKDYETERLRALNFPARTH